MATEAQIEANRLNAQKSTGPRTPEGKEKASQNALKHGLLARQVVVPGEDPQEFEAHRAGLLAEMAPAGPLESLLAERIVGLSWRLLRAERVQTAVVGTLAEEKKKSVWSKEDNQYVVLQGTKPGPVAAGSSSEGRNVQNEANSPIGAGWDGAAGAGDAGQSCKTNPISVGRPRPQEQNAQNEPNSGGV